MNIHEIFMSHRHNPVLHQEVTMDINQHSFYGNIFSVHIILLLEDFSMNMHPIVNLVSMVIYLCTW